MTPARAAAGFCILSLSAPSAPAQSPPLIEPQAARALATELSGETARRNLEQITRQHRIRGSRQFRLAADFIVEELRAYGLHDAHVEEFPADGHAVVRDPARAARVGRRLRRTVGSPTGRRRVAAPSGARGLHWRTRPPATSRVSGNTLKGRANRQKAVVDLVVKNRSMLMPTGHQMEALEAVDEPHEAYRFAILGDFEADPWELFQQLYAKMRREIATCHVHRTEFGWQITREQRLVGRIESDLNSDTRMPLVVIDGKPFTWEQVGQMLMTFEGFTLEARIKDTIEVLGKED